MGASLTLPNATERIGVSAGKHDDEKKVAASKEILASSNEYIRYLLSNDSFVHLLRDPRRLLPKKMRGRNFFIPLRNFAVTIAVYAVQPPAHGLRDEDFHWVQEGLSTSAVI